MSKTIAGACILLVGLGVAACGGSGDSTFGSPGDGSENKDPGSGSFQEIGPNGTMSACVSSTANAALQPVNLVMMFDKSGSMGDTTNQPQPFDPNLKWNPVTAGMKSFLADPGSSTMNASLQFFPWGDDVAGVCGYDYATPKVSLTPLSNSAPFVSAIDATKPQGGTPTLPALKGAIAYGKQTMLSRPGEKTVIVLITDGEPGITINGSFQPGCTDNDIPHVAAAAAEAYASGLPTYVIGIGPSLDKLNAIAQAGGTQAAMMVDVSDPGKTTGIFQSTLDKIRETTLTCLFDIPPAPAGQTLDTNAVNVVYTPPTGAQTVLSYSKDCSDPNGWHYDNPASPTKIELCQSSCGTAQRERNGKLTLAFGCATKGDLR